MSVWRFSRLPDYLRIVGATSATVICSIAAAFAYNRLEGVPRSLPVFALLVASSLLVAVRVACRVVHTMRQKRKTLKRQPVVEVLNAVDNVLVVGVTPLAEAYLQGVREFGAGTIRIAGIVGRSSSQTGRLLSDVEILGTPEEIDRIVRDLEVHGIRLDRIVVSLPAEQLSEDARAQLLHLERAADIELRFLVDDLGFRSLAMKAQQRTDSRVVQKPSVSFDLPEARRTEILARPFWGLKRLFDFSLALMLLVALAPVMALVAMSVAASIGSPIVFWQLRPGRMGHGFRLYKFRTMSAQHDASGRSLADDERVSRVGNFLRKTRLDELPQLVNILRGEMSFVGPRPLLPRDQSEAYWTRLLVRPGLTGWAQVAGGREISAEDKAALDIWYVHNADARRDIQIVMRTIPMILRGERTSAEQIRRAWSDLESMGLVRRHGRAAGRRAA
ncbi:MAG: sugar transferase [Hyphomicrobiaceae bacterium]